MDQDQLSQLPDMRGAGKAGDFIKVQRTRMEQARAMAPEMKGRYVKSRVTGNYFGWTPHAELHPDMETMPEGFEPPYVKDHRESVERKAAAKAATAVVKDGYDDMSLDDLKARAKERDIDIDGRVKDPEKFKAKLRAWDVLNEGE